MRDTVGRKTQGIYKSLKYDIERAKILSTTVQMGNPRVRKFKEPAQNQGMEVCTEIQL